MVTANDDTKESRRSVTVDVAALRAWLEEQVQVSHRDATAQFRAGLDRDGSRASGEHWAYRTALRWLDAHAAPTQEGEPTPEELIWREGFQDGLKEADPMLRDTAALLRVELHAAEHRAERAERELRECRSEHFRNRVEDDD